MSIGQKSYEAFFAYSGGKDTKGEDLPTWDLLDTLSQLAWSAAGDTAKNETFDDVRATVTAKAQKALESAIASLDALRQAIATIKDSQL